MELPKFLKDSFYQEFIKSSSTFNHELVRERKFRLPFLDSQTGVAQGDCSLWMTEKDRVSQGDSSGRVYKYPSKRWIKRKRQYLLDDIYNQHQCNNQHQFNHINNSNHHQPQQQQNYLSDNDSINHNNNNSLNHNNNNNNSSQHHYNNDSSFMHDSSSNSNAHPWTINEQSKDATTSSKADPDESTSEATAHGDLDDSNDPHSTAQPNDLNHNHNNNNNHNQNQQQHQQQNQIQCNSQSQPANNTAPTPKKKRERKNKIEKTNDLHKPYRCDWCGMSYTSRPGLTYHRNRCHAKNVVSNSSDETIIGEEPTKGTVSSNDGKPYCDFCLGDVDMNKKTGQPEELVSCSDCGRSGHPTCLNFTPNIILSVRKYLWQCIECKSCGLCGTSDNDDQLLFCDDCDRGYHMYCLKPPLEKPPEGSWSCTLCIEEYHKTEDGIESKSKS